MKVRFSFTLKIFLPYLVFALIFFFVFLVEFRRGQPLEAWISFTGLVVALIFGINQIVWLKRSLERTRRVIAQLTRGNIPDFEARDVKDEIGDLERSLEKYIANLKEMVAFSRSMATGDYTGHYEKLSGEDELGDALNKLKGNLMESMKDSEARRLEEERRTWSAQGLARFSTFFRETEDDLENLSMLLMKELIDYTEADVGALFIATEEEGEGETNLQISGSYAFDRSKQIDRSFRFGEGLVGRAALEKELIYLTDVPPEYMKIHSGLGEDTPSSILLVPVVLDQHVLGVMELASLGEMPPYQIDFIRKLCDALATTLSKVKANMQNRKLFEQTKKQAEALASQEKVFRKKLEQLELEREHALAKESELLKEIEALRKGST